MLMRNFAEAFIAGDQDELRRVLAEDVVFRSPAVFTPYEGIEQVIPVLLAAREVLADIRYGGSVAQGNQEVFFFNAMLDRRLVEGVDYVVTGEDGRVLELTVMIRPLSALQKVVEAMGDVLAKGRR